MKGKSILEVVALFIIMKFLSIWIDSLLAGAEVNPGWRTFVFGLQAIVIPVAIITITGRKWVSYGFLFKNKKQLIDFGFIGAMLMLLLGMGFGFLKSQGISTNGRMGSLVLSIVALAMISLFIFFARISEWRKRSERSKRIRTTYQLVILVLMVSVPVIAAIFTEARVSEIIAWDLYFLIMVGFGEEIKYRGYFQSRINEEYGCPYKLFGISFGPGLIIVSLIFGFSHTMQFGLFNPFLGQYEINIWMGLQAFFGGIFFGLIREKSKSIISSGIAHGVPNAFGQVLAMALK